MFSSSSSPPLQLFFSWIPPWPLPLLSFLLSELHAQPDITLPLFPAEVGAAAAPCVSTAFLVAAFQALQYCFVKCWKGWGKI